MAPPAKDVAVYVALCAGVPKCVVKNENIPTSSTGTAGVEPASGRVARGLEIDDDVRHGEVEALAGAVDDVRVRASSSGPPDASR